MEIDQASRSYVQSLIVSRKLTIFVSGTYDNSRFHPPSCPCPVVATSSTPGPHNLVQLLRFHTATSLHSHNKHQSRSRRSAFVGRTPSSIPQVEPTTIDQLHSHRKPDTSHLLGTRNPAQRTPDFATAWQPKIYRAQLHLAECDCGSSALVDPSRGHAKDKKTP
jgi:hypothetical protein